MGQLRGGPDLAVEALKRFRAPEQALVDDLDRHRPVHEAVPALVNDAHAAAAELADEGVLRVVRQFRWQGPRRRERGGRGPVGAFRKVG